MDGVANEKTLTSTATQRGKMTMKMKQPTPQEEVGHRYPRKFFRSEEVTMWGSIIQGQTKKAKRLSNAEMYGLYDVVCIFCCMMLSILLYHISPFIITIVKRQETQVLNMYVFLYDVLSVLTVVI
jgi:hypothetical protein